MPRCIGRKRVLIRTSVVVLAYAGIAAAAGDVAFDLRPIGLTGQEHVRADGLRRNVAAFLSDTGYVAGYAERYNGSSSLGRSAWVFDGVSTLEVGMTDFTHTRDDGYRYSQVSFMGSSGIAYGYAERYDGSLSMGTSAWVHAAGATSAIGLTGSEYLRDDGYRYNAIWAANDSGDAAGYAERFIGSTNHGRSAWVHTGLVTNPIGLLGAEHTRSDGYRYSTPRYLSEAGPVTGVSDRFDGTTDIGRSAWLYDGSTSFEIGLIGSEHTNDDGFRYSVAWDINDAGHVVGSSDRFDGPSSRGRSSWIYNGAATVEIGLMDASHTMSNGYRWSYSFEMNAASHAIGTSTRYDANDNNIGSSAWYYDGSSTIPVGLTDAEHTASNGFRDSLIYFGWDNISNPTAKGPVIGRSERFNGGTTSLGWSAWVVEGGQTVEIGLVGPEHVRGDGYVMNETRLANSAGRVTGTTERFAGFSSRGQSAWYYDGETTDEIGLLDPAHTRSDGTHSNDPRYINSAGMVGGRARRYVGPSTAGFSAWIYDPISDTSLDLTLSVRDDGFADSLITFLSDDGVALGQYELFDGSTSLGDRAFYWSMEDGLHDLGSLVNGGLTGAGWEALFSSLRQNGLDQIAGNGLLLDNLVGGSDAFFMTAIPEPGASLVYLAAGLLLAHRPPRCRSQRVA